MVIAAVQGMADASRRQRASISDLQRERDELRASLSTFQEECEKGRAELQRLTDSEKRLLGELKKESEQVVLRDARIADLQEKLRVEGLRVDAHRRELDEAHAFLAANRGKLVISLERGTIHVEAERSDGTKSTLLSSGF